MIRWPGGCYSDRYQWRDGIGERAVRTNAAWGGTVEPNTFGTHEFFNLTERLGAKTYLNINLGTGTPKDAADWLEYITATVGDRADERRANGRDDPWTIDYLAIGNETWGCGGHMTPVHYIHVYKRYATFLKAPEGNRPKRVASGGSNEDTAWTEALASGTPGSLIDGVSHHYYTLPTGNWPKKGNSTGFPEAEWISTLANTMKVDDYLAANAAVLDEHDPEGRIGIYLDEWGTWYDPEEGHEPGFLYQQNSLRDALVAALNFNIFHRHTKRLHMANIAQTVNVLQAVVLTEGDRMVRTPTYHAFMLYKPFMDATFIPVAFDDMSDYEVGDVAVPHLSASAALTPDGDLVVALVNLHASEAANVSGRFAGFDPAGARGLTLTGDTIDAHNTFDAPNAVEPRPAELDFDDGVLELTLPARSVTVVTLKK